ncbi:hypothetical protein BTE77_34675 [Ensifer adhaerens]|nr:hypothetical protein BTE77_34675 [Ensifer adhaerens]
MLPQPTQTKAEISVSEKKADMHRRLWAAIAEGRLEPGSKIVEREILEPYGVSFTISRQVLMTLEQQGMVTLTPNHGAAVASPSRLEAIARVRIAALLAADAAGEMSSAKRRLRLEAVGICTTLVTAANNDDEAAAVSLFLQLINLMATHAAGPLMAEQTLIAVAAAKLAMRANRCERPLLHVATELEQSLSIGDTDLAQNALRGYYDAVTRKLQAPAKSGRLRDMFLSPPAGMFSPPE